MLGMFPNYVLWLKRTISALLYDDTNHEMLVGNGKKNIGIGVWDRTMPSRTSVNALFKTEHGLLRLFKYTWRRKD